MKRLTGRFRPASLAAIAALVLGLAGTNSALAQFGGNNGNGNNTPAPRGGPAGKPHPSGGAPAPAATGKAGGNWRGGSAANWHGSPGAWHGGNWQQGWHNGRYGWWWAVPGYDWYAYDAPMYPYPTYPAAPPPPPLGYWYYCANPAGYYPYVQQCAAPWQPVPPQGG